MAYAIPKHCQLRQYPFSVQFLLKNGALFSEFRAFCTCGMRGVRGAPGEHRAPIHYLCALVAAWDPIPSRTHPHQGKGSRVGVDTTWGFLTLSVTPPTCSVAVAYIPSPPLQAAFRQQLQNLFTNFASCSTEKR